MTNILLMAAFALFFIFDVIKDLKDGLPLAHILHEVILFVASLGAIIYQIFLLYKKDAHITSLNFRLVETQKAHQEWKQKTGTSAMQIRASIDQQFDLWHLSHSERDIALLLIKGLSMKEIAEIRQTHEKTVRHQSTNIYKKSGLSGRQELAAFFLEDILSTPTLSN